MQGLTESDMKEVFAERLLVDKLRNAVQNCKSMLGMSQIRVDENIGAPERMQMERCLTENYLLKFGMDYFGKRDLIYVDMQGDRDIERLYTKELIAEVGVEEAAEMGADVEDVGDDEWNYSREYLTLMK